MPVLNPLDGRYAPKLTALSQLLGEEALLRARIQVECEYFIALSKAGLFSLNNKEESLLRSLHSPTAVDIKIVHDIEFKGYKNIKATNHDVKAVEYYLKDKLSGTSLKNRLEWLHFAMTSEDTNSLSYALMIRDGIEQVLLPILAEVRKILLAISKKYASAPLLARTHGQPAVPTTFGKEFKVFEYRLARQLEQLKKQRLSCKLGGAVGNFNAHSAAFNNINWPRLAAGLVSGLNKGHKTKIFAWEVSTQIDPHDTYAELFDNLRRVNMIFIDFAQDVWRYISDGLIKQRAVAGEIGSSAMPQKVNPIDFENAEGNLGLANALFGYFSGKLTVSRLQRDLSDSTVQRNIGPAFGYCVVGWRALLKGLGKIDIDAPAAAAMLERHPEVLAEGIQTILRAHGVAGAYEKLKDFTRGKKITKADIAAFIEGLSVPADVKNKLKKLDVKNYTGAASALARKA
ncbi:MAG: adenylosuccinate lyase [Elusimicrobiota bacterium]|jgi:adenylosuccinate lyase|nr:adenylosuccinate lyase [Elusimicrobiota bacterium]